MSFSTVQSRFLFIVMLVTTAVFGSFGYVNHHLNETARLKLVNDNVERLAKRMSTSLSIALWELNTDSVREIVDSESADPFIV